MESSDGSEEDEIIDLSEEEEEEEEDEDENENEENVDDDTEPLVGPRPTEAASSPNNRVKKDETEEEYEPLRMTSEEDPTTDDYQVLTTATNPTPLTTDTNREEGDGADDNVDDVIGTKARYYVMIKG